MTDFLNSPPESRLTTPIVLASEFGDMRLELDRQTGGPRRVWDAERPQDGVALAASVTVDEGGTERRGAAGGLVYEELVTVVPAGPIRSVREQVELTSRVFFVELEAGNDDPWAITWVYRLGTDWPRVSVALECTARTDHALARNVHLDVEIEIADRDDWGVHAPGAMLRPGLSPSLLPPRLQVLPIGGVAGGAGLVLLERPEADGTLLIWPLSTTEIGDIHLTSTPDGVAVSWATDVAGQPGAGGVLRAGSLHLDLLDRPAAGVLADVRAPLAQFGLTSPGAPPDWSRTANVFEVQVGFSVFWGGHRYAPYPEISDLVDDLDRIADLGFNVLQLMPRHPYPSYNVHGLGDIDTTWGDEAELRRLVALCHERGLKVILDLLLHGVIDGEAMEVTVDAIRSGPYADRLDEVVGDITVLESDDDGVVITWSRHVLDFEPYWVAGSPHHHSLLDEHPEWFCRTSEGEVTGMYTKAFDCAHPGWQRAFVDGAVDIAERLDADGFRLDAPTYNYFHNWDDRTRSNAAVSMLGSLRVFAMLREELLARRPGSLLYTEPSGLLHRTSTDLNYNYDELWLVKAVLERGAGKPHWLRDARGLMAWFAERDACLPVGAMTAHHIDSHDSFWWPEWGTKWRREQFGQDATRALMTLFCLSGGAYMTFVGGETGMEDDVRRVNRLRVDRPFFADGTSDFTAVRTDSDDVYAVVRSSAAGAGLVVVELGGAPRTVRLDLDACAIGSGAGPLRTVDALGGPERTWRSAGGSLSCEIELGAYQALALELPTTP